MKEKDATEKQKCKVMKTLGICTKIGGCLYTVLTKYARHSYPPNA